MLKEIGHERFKKRVTYQSQTHICTLPTCWIINLVSITILSTSFIHVGFLFDIHSHVFVTISTVPWVRKNYLALSMQIGKRSHVKNFLLLLNWFVVKFSFLLNARWLTNDRSILFFTTQMICVCVWLASLRDFSLNPFAFAKLNEMCVCDRSCNVIVSRCIYAHNLTWCVVKIKNNNFDLNNLHLCRHFKA